jgi:hypothetical protein
MKKKSVLLVFIILILVSVTSNLGEIRKYLRKNLPPEIKVSIKKFFFGEEYLLRIKELNSMNYNQKALPGTQFEIINLKKIKLDLTTTDKIHYFKVMNYDKKVKKFYIDIDKINKNIIVVSGNGNIKIIQDFNKFKENELKNNLSEFNIHSVLDIEFVNNELFISSSTFRNNKTDCFYVQLLKSEVNTEKLKFKKIYETKNCIGDILASRIHKYIHRKVEGVLLTLGASGDDRDLAQDDNSHFGKIIFLNLNGEKIEVFSKGHRNPQGITVNNNIIISTEHGPYGGDEINKIEYNKNYGWPIASYGEPYSFGGDYGRFYSDGNVIKVRDDFVFKKSHSKNNFSEPLFVFVPSIGISEIIKVPKDFSKYWKINNYLVTSLNGRSIYRVEIDDQFNKVLFVEKIYIGERIRDIKYSKKLNSFILALEDSGSLGLLSSPQSIN